MPYASAQAYTTAARAPTAAELRGDDWENVTNELSPADRESVIAHMSEGNGSAALHELRQYFDGEWSVDGVPLRVHDVYVEGSSEADFVRGWWIFVRLAP